MTLTTLPGGSPARTRSSTRATAARPASSVKSSRQTGGRRVTHVVRRPGDLGEQLDGGRAAADDEHVQAGELGADR